MHAQFTPPKAVADNDVVGKDVVVNSPAETRILFDQSLDVFKALLVFRVPLSCANAISGLVNSQ